MTAVPVIDKVVALATDNESIDHGAPQRKLGKWRLVLVCTLQ